MKFEPLALTPLGGHPLYHYQMLYSGLCYFSSLLFSIFFLIFAFEFLPHDVQVLSLPGYMSVTLHLVWKLHLYDHVYAPLRLEIGL